MLGTMSMSTIRPAATVDRDQAVEELFATQYTSLLRLATLVLGNRAAAEDAVQEAFVKRAVRRLENDLGRFARVFEDERPKALRLAYALIGRYPITPRSQRMLSPRRSHARSGIGSRVACKIQSSTCAGPSSTRCVALGGDSRFVADMRRANGVLSRGPSSATIALRTPIGCEPR